MLYRDEDLAVTLLRQTDPLFGLLSARQLLARHTVEPTAEERRGGR